MHVLLADQVHHVAAQCLPPNLLAHTTCGPALSMGLRTTHPDIGRHHRPSASEQGCAMVYHQELRYCREQDREGILHASEELICCQHHHAVSLRTPDSFECFGTNTFAQHNLRMLPHPHDLLSRPHHRRKTSPRHQARRKESRKREMGELAHRQRNDRRRTMATHVGAPTTSANTWDSRRHEIAHDTANAHIQ